MRLRLRHTHTHDLAYEAGITTKVNDLVAGGMSGYIVQGFSTHTFSENFNRLPHIFFIYALLNLLLNMLQCHEPFGLLLV